jgi:hypothetical protein
VRYWKARTTRPVPRIVVRGAADEAGATRPLINSHFNPQKRISRTSLTDVANMEGAIGAAARHSRSNSRSSRGSATHPPESPPPPYSPPNIPPGVILPYATGVAPGAALPFATNAPGAQPSGSQSRLQFPESSQPVRRHSAVDSALYKRSPNKTPVAGRQSHPLTPATLDYGLQSRPLSRSSEFVNRPSTTGANSHRPLTPTTSNPVRHPMNPNLILPFAIPEPAAQSPSPSAPTVDIT